MSLRSARALATFKSSGDNVPPLPGGSAGTVYWGSPGTMSPYCLGSKGTLSLDCPGTLSPHCPGVVVVHCSFCLPQLYSTYYKFSNSRRFCYILWNTIASSLTVSISFSNASLIFTFVNKKLYGCLVVLLYCIALQIDRQIDLNYTCHPSNTFIFSQILSYEQKWYFL